jgi:hypothetical protein
VSKHEREAGRKAKREEKLDQRRTRRAARAAEERHLGHISTVDPTANANQERRI